MFLLKKNYNINLHDNLHLNSMNKKVVNKFTTHIEDNLMVNHTNHHVRKIEQLHQYDNVNFHTTENIINQSVLNKFHLFQNDENIFNKIEKTFNMSDHSVHNKAFNNVSSNTDIQIHKHRTNKISYHI